MGDGVLPVNLEEAFSLCTGTDEHNLSFTINRTSIGIWDPSLSARAYAYLSTFTAKAAGRPPRGTTDSHHRKKKKTVQPRFPGQLDS